jgi:small conductance mechanosensitive channel
MTLWVRLFGHQPDWQVALGALLVALVVAAACAEVIAALVRRVFLPARRGEQRSRKVRGTIRLVRLLLLVVLTVVFIPPVLEVFGQPLSAGLRLSALLEWLLGPGIKALFTITAAYLVVRIIDAATNTFERHLSERHGAETDGYAKRARTLGDLARNTSTVLVVLIATIYVLEEVLNLDLLPLLTGASIIGLWFGLGSQTLVKDLISGFFLILENQIRVGDLAEINGTGGLVEAIHLRTVVLRDHRGAVHIFPCGGITSLANLTKDFSYAVLDVRVHYRHDTDRVIDVLRKTAATLQSDPDLASSVFGPLEVLGIEQLGDTGVTIRVRMKTIPLRQFDVTRELRRRVKKAFEAEGIEIPVLQMVGPSQATTK